MFAINSSTAAFLFCCGLEQQLAFHLLPLPQQDAIDCAAAALEKFSVEKEVAAFIKKEFDRK